MGSVLFKSRQDKLIKRLSYKQRQIIYEKWKYDIIQCYITFDNTDENKTFMRFNNHSIGNNMDDIQ